MQKSIKINEKLKNQLTILAVSAIGVYFIGTLFQPQDVEALAELGLTPTSARLISIFMIALPISLAWAILAKAVYNVQGYANFLKTGTEAKAFTFIASGLMVLLSTDIIGALLNQISTYSPEQKELVNTIIVANAMIDVVAALGLFILMYYGVSQLTHLIKIDRKRLFRNHLIISAVTALAPVVFIGNSIFTNSERALAAGTEGAPITNFFSDWQVVAFILLPYLIAWTAGNMAILSMLTYRSKVKGIIYKNSVKRFAQGLTMLVILQIGLQILGQASDLFDDNTLALLLGVIAIIIIMIVVAYALIASGASKLRRLEEV